MIGISCSLLKTQIPNTITNERYHLSVDYVEAVTKAGAISCMLPILKPDQAREVVSQLDGIILSGGNDISPSFYENTTGKVVPSQDVVLERDLYEIALCQEALRQQKPILGICRGAQLLNIVLGGTLIPEINDSEGINHVQNGQPTEASHKITIEKQSDLYRIVKETEVGVNSYHHQAIHKLGKQLAITAKSEDGYIEAIEYQGNSFALGLQWHPEIMAGRQDNMAALFDFFVNQTRQIEAGKMIV